MTARHPDLARVIDAEAKRRVSDNQRLRQPALQGGASA
jgi:hypothetical protein